MFLEEVLMKHFYTSQKLAWKTFKVFRGQGGGVAQAILNLFLL